MHDALRFGAPAASSHLCSSDLSRILQAAGIQVPNTNVARAFRDVADDPVAQSFWTGTEGGNYAITEAGSAAIRDLVDRKP